MTNRDTVVGPRWRNMARRFVQYRKWCGRTQQLSFLVCAVAGWISYLTACFPHQRDVQGGAIVDV
jgi:hypothetical protein